MPPCYLFVAVVCSVRLVGPLNCDGLALGMDQMPRRNVEFQLDLKLGFSCPFNEGVAQAVSLSGKHWGFVWKEGTTMGSQRVFGYNTDMRYVLNLKSRMSLQIKAKKTQS